MRQREKSAVTVCGSGRRIYLGATHAREVSLVAPGSLFVIPVMEVALRVEAVWAGKVSSICQGRQCERDETETRAHTE